jgi:hypothetical protein
MSPATAIAGPCGARSVDQTGHGPKSIDLEEQGDPCSSQFGGGTRMNDI